MGDHNVHRPGSQRVLSNAAANVASSFSDGTQLQGMEKQFAIILIKLQAEFGFPSTHAIAGASLAFGTLLSVCGPQDAIFPFGLLLAIAFTAWVAFSRLYKG